MEKFTVLKLRKEKNIRIETSECRVADVTEFKSHSSSAPVGITRFILILTAGTFSQVLLTKSRERPGLFFVVKCIEKGVYTEKDANLKLEKLLYYNQDPGSKIWMRIKFLILLKTDLICVNLNKTETCKQAIAHPWQVSQLFVYNYVYIDSKLTIQSRFDQAHRK
uniref:Protein kinase domain-containing protein n=1 Tax=Tetranychus urticae TaxID=32264 RepID=T1KW04_TETUR